MSGEGAVPVRGRTAVVLVCDERLIVPTIGTAIAARRHVSDPAVAVQVFLTDVAADLLARVRAIAAPLGVHVAPAPVPDLRSLGAGRFSPDHHISAAALARLWIDDFLDPDVRRFLYLDGDVDVAGTLDPLLAAAVPAGGFLAGPDLPFLIQGEAGNRAAWIGRYLAGLGVADWAAYFNSGVLLVDRDGWRDIGMAAAEFFRRYPERCHWHDQSALNAVAGGHRGTLSPRWNYVSEFMAVLDPRGRGHVPAIWHFTGLPKPWHAPGATWGAGHGSSFALGDAALAPLGLTVGRPPEATIAQALSTAARIRRRNRWLYPWRARRRAARLLAALHAAP